jgi:hypothetical protein
MKKSIKLSVQVIQEAACNCNEPLIRNRRSSVEVWNVHSFLSPEMSSYLIATD